MARSIALVTGASAGIGRAFAERLAAHGDDLVVVARDTTRLEVLAKELDATFGTKVEVLTADLTTGQGVAAVEARIVAEEHPVDLLVNNARVQRHSGSSHELPIAGEITEIGLDIVAVARLTHAGLEGMVRRGRGGVINVASIAAYQPTPGNATYRRDQGVRQQPQPGRARGVEGRARGSCARPVPGVHPVPVASRPRASSSSEVPDFLWREPAEVVDHTLAAFAKGRAVCVPGPLNRPPPASPRWSPRRSDARSPASSSAAPRSSAQGGAALRSVDPTGASAAARPGRHPLMCPRASASRSSTVPASRAWSSRSPRTRSGRRRRSRPRRPRDRS